MSIPVTPTSNDPGPPMAHDHFDTPIFHRLLALIADQTAAIKDQHATIQQQKETLVEHGRKLDTLVKDAIKDDQPYDEEPYPQENEQSWNAVYEIAASKMKEEADEWKGLMDVSLVFIAIFLTVLTAFLVPAAQNLLPPPSSNSTASNTTSPPPPLPPRSDENVCALYYLALVMAMCNAVLCVIGRQWVGKLLSRPLGKTYRERTMRHEERKRLAYGWIRPLVVVLYWSLLLSIGLFVAGLLYQLRNLATSFDQTAVTLQAAWALSVLIVSGIIAIILSSAVHAVRYENSPFEGVISKTTVKILMLLASRWAAFGRWRITFDWRSGEQLLKTYLELISEADDPKLLDRAVSSFSYGTWAEHGGSSIDLLQRAYDRLMAQDTSTRVRETVKAQLSRFAQNCRKQSWEIGAVRWVQSDLVEFLVGNPRSARDDIAAEVTIISYRENNEDLREIGGLPTEECIAKVLCTYDQDKTLGSRDSVFLTALRLCRNLMKDEKEDAVIRIFSHVQPLSVLRSYMRCSFMFIVDDFLFPFLMTRLKNDLFVCVNDFLKNPPPFVNIWVVPRVLLAAVEAGTTIPHDIDFSPIVDYLSAQPYPATNDAFLNYLSRTDLTLLSKPAAIYKFLQLCAAVELNFPDMTNLFRNAKHLNSPATRDLARELMDRMAQLGFVILSPPSQSLPSISDDNSFSALPNGVPSEDLPDHHILPPHSPSSLHLAIEGT